MTCYDDAINLCDNVIFNLSDLHLVPCLHCCTTYRLGAPLPPPLPRTLLTFIVPMLCLDESTVIASVGLDVAMLLRIIRFCRFALLAGSSQSVALAAALAAGAAAA